MHTLWVPPDGAGIARRNQWSLSEMWFHRDLSAGPDGQPAEPAPCRTRSSLPATTRTDSPDSERIHAASAANSGSACRTGTRA
jgi:hypothetical protein